MKNKITILFFIAFFTMQSIASFAQKIEFTPLIGYTYGCNFNIDGGRARIADGNTFGGIIGINMGQGKVLEFLYKRQVTNVYANSKFLISNVNEPATMNSFLFGPTKNFRIKNENITPFVSFKIGWETLNPRNLSFSSITCFDADISTGIKYKMTKSMALNLNCGLNLPVIGGGATLWWSPGYGTSVGYSGYVPFVQFNMLAGVVIKI